MAASTTLDPEARRERARKAAAASNAPDAVIGRLVRLADRLTDEHRAQLRELAEATG